MLIGVHVSIEDGICNATKRAKRLGCNTMQIFARNPRKWRVGFLGAEEIKEFNSKRKKHGIHPFFIHLPYLANLASPNPKLYSASIKAYIVDILEAQKLGAGYVVTHMGSHKKTSEKQGLKRFTKALNIILAETSKTDVNILLENTTGSGSWLGYDFSHHQYTINGVKKKERIGLCLDTAHAYLAGYDISREDGFCNVIYDIEKAVGVNLIKLVHLNDTSDKLGSKRDRHEHIGQGRIGLPGLKRFINHPKLKRAAFILETPKKEIGDDHKNLKRVRSLVKK